MWPVLFRLPAWIPILLIGGVLGAALLTGKEKGKARVRAVLGAVLGALAGLGLGAWRGWLSAWMPIHGYGAVLVVGFVAGVWVARRRARSIGVDPDDCIDMGLWGLVAGLAGARLFHVIENWHAYNPLGEGGLAAFWSIFKLWEGGLVFYGAFIAAITVAVLYCRVRRIPVLPFLDLAAPALIAGYAFGRLGCFMRGCCFGRPCEWPWAVHFAHGSPAHLEHVSLGLIGPNAPGSLAVHPTQIYAAIGAGLTAAFLYAFWPRRRYDGQVVALMVAMAGATRFFEEFLRADTPAAFPRVAVSLSIAQWMGMGLVAVGLAALAFFRRRNVLYVPPVAPVAPGAGRPSNGAHSDGGC